MSKIQFSLYRNSNEYQKNWDRIFKKSLIEKIKIWIDKFLFNLFIKETK